MSSFASRRKGRALWLPDVLSDAGVPFLLVPGWEKRGKKPKEWLGLVPHHTASNPKGGAAPSLPILKDGRAGIPGPLANISTGRDAIVRVVAAGAANHPGVSELILPGRTISSGVKYYTLGDEVELSGVGEPFPTSGRQYEVAHRAWAAIFIYLGLDPLTALQDHKMIARPKGRKIDIRPYDLSTGRRKVRSLMDGTLPPPKSTPKPKPAPAPAPKAPTEEEELMAAKDDILMGVQVRLNAVEANLNAAITAAADTTRPFAVRIADNDPATGLEPHKVWVCDAFTRRQVASRALLNTLYLMGLVRVPPGGPMHEPKVKAAAIVELRDVTPDLSLYK